MADYERFRLTREPVHEVLGILRLQVYPINQRASRLLVDQESLTEDQFIEQTGIAKENCERFMRAGLLRRTPDGRYSGTHLTGPSVAAIEEFTAVFNSQVIASHIKVFEKRGLTEEAEAIKRSWEETENKSQPTSELPGIMWEISEYRRLCILLSLPLPDQLPASSAEIRRLLCAENKNIPRSSFKYAMDRLGEKKLTESKGSLARLSDRGRASLVAYDACQEMIVPFLKNPN